MGSSFKYYYHTAYSTDKPSPDSGIQKTDITRN